MIYLASFKGTKPGWQGWVERITRWATKSEYSHSEICYSNPFESATICLSSVGTDGGVRGKVIQLDPKDWSIVALPWVTLEDATRFLEKNRGYKYDLIGCVRSVVPFVSQEHPEKWFCSEVCGSVMGIKDSWRFPPGDLHVIAAVMRDMWNLKV